MAKVKECEKINVWLPTEQMTSLREASEITGVAMSRIFRDAVERELKRIKPLIETAKQLKK